jgi:hypothetical protein
MLDGNPVCGLEAEALVFVAHTARAALPGNCGGLTLAVALDTYAEEVGLPAPDVQHNSDWI